MRLMVAAALLASAFGSVGAAHAQTAIEGRVDRLEREMRAVQRKVFPGGAGQTVEPDIKPQVPQTVPGTPATSPVADLTARVAALESQLTTITGNVEQNGYRLRQLEDAFNAYKRSTDARIKALEDTASTVGAGAPAGGAGPSLSASADAAGATATVRPPASKPGKTAAKPAPAAEPADTGTGGATGMARSALLASVEKPSTGDPAEDGYAYGFRLWQAKLYPEAREALKEVVAKYPKHRRASYAQNLLGRAYLDGGAPSLAAVAFYDNYKKMPDGERAPDSLYYLAQALVKLKKPAAEVCKVYGELTDVYGDRLSSELKAQVAEGRAASKCS